MGPENEANHGQALPRERRSLRKRWLGFLMVMGLGGFGRWMLGAGCKVLDCGPQQSNPHPEVPRRGLEGRGLRAWGRSARRMLRGFVLRPKHLSMRAVGAATHLARNKGGMVKRSWMSACRRMPYAGCTAATLILRCPAGASKDEGCGTRAQSTRRMLQGFALRSKHLSMRRWVWQPTLLETKGGW